MVLFQVHEFGSPNEQKKEQDGGGEEYDEEVELNTYDEPDGSVPKIGEWYQHQIYIQ